MTSFRTDQLDSVVADAISITGANGDQIGAYLARPMTPGPHPAVVLIHHAPGGDDWYHENTLRFARKGYIAICPNLYHRLGTGTISEVNERYRALGAIPDAEVVGDIHGAIAHVRGFVPSTTARSV